MSAAHFIFIPAVLVVGIVIGWILGSRAAQDAYAAELKRRKERADRQIPSSKSQAPTTPNSQIPNATSNDQLPTSTPNKNSQKT
jgi:hypothetical protein